MGASPNPNVPLWGEASLEQVESWLPVIEARFEIAVAEVDANGTQRIVEYTNSRGDALTSNVDEMLTHTLLHSTQYRGEAAAFLNQAGQRVPDLDYIFWLRAGEPAWLGRPTVHSLLASRGVSRYSGARPLPGGSEEFQ